MAYPTDGGIHILDLATQSESVLNLDIGSFDLHWSPDGSRITFVGLSDTIINSAFIVDTSTGETRQISEWSYELIAGWSPDGTQLYYAVPFTGGAAWKIYRYNLNDGQTQELFTIENATAKALEPRISPDGQWIAYRGHDNSSVYLIRSDGSDERLVVENGSANGLAWTASGWLGVSLHDYQSEQTTLALIDPETCTIYRTTGLSGQLEDLYLP
jgi:Tol biopolymer transport system component